MKKNIFKITILSLTLISALGFAKDYRGIKNKTKKTTYATIKNSNANISSEKAKSIALAHAKIDKNNVTFTKIKLDKEDGRLVYEIDFFSGNRKYEYEIDANTGTVLSFDLD